MLRRLYAHNFRCFENFELRLDGHSALLIGNNGTGKSTVRAVLRLVQALGQGVHRIGALIGAADFALGRTTVPVRIELDARIGEHDVSYTLAVELPPRFREPRVADEQLVVDGVVVFSRTLSDVVVFRSDPSEVRFAMDWHLAALPIIQGARLGDVVDAFKRWIAGMVLLAPIPSRMLGEAAQSADIPTEDAANWGDWTAGLLERNPSAYVTLREQVQAVLPDVVDLRFERVGREARVVMVRFRVDRAEVELPFSALSDGEKCYFLAATLVAAHQHDGPLFTFWDEVDNHISNQEIGLFVTSLRRAVQGRGQFVITSHRPEVWRRFSDDNTWLLGRRSHLEPVTARRLVDLPPDPNLLQAVIDGEVDPWR
jgi:ABC-type transport system involved in cytochrome c biogenesis ATPase subunit